MIIKLDQCSGLLGVGQGTVGGAKSCYIGDLARRIFLFIFAMVVTLHRFVVVFPLMGMERKSYFNSLNVEVQ